MGLSCPLDFHGGRSGLGLGPDKGSGHVLALHLGSACHQAFWTLLTVWLRIALRTKEPEIETVSVRGLRKRL